MKTLKTAYFILGATLSVSAMAEPDIIYTQNPTPKTTTHSLLEMQRSGKNASADEQYLSGKVSTKIYNRYVESFAHSIPERFSSDSFTEE